MRIFDGARECLEGQLIAIDGSDCSGKKTQIIRLEERIQGLGLDVLKLRFPRYGEPAAADVEKYLKGLKGNINALNPREVSRWYAEDRADAAEEIKEALEVGKVVLCDRYVASNMGHQAGKCDLPYDRIDLIQWIDYMEYEELGVVRPDLNILLVTPIDIALERVKEKRSLSSIRDIHEEDEEHLRRATETFRLLSSVLGIPIAECFDWSVEVVERLIWIIIERELYTHKL